MDCLAVLLAQHPHAQHFVLSNQMFRLRRHFVPQHRPVLSPSHIKKKAPRLRCVIFKWWWEMDCLAVLLAQHPHAQHFVLSNQMFRLRRHFVPQHRPVLSPSHIKKKAPRLRCVIFKWWWEMDSNHRSQRQQIYSLPPLATRESHRDQSQLERVTGVEPV